MFQLTPARGERPFGLCLLGQSLGVSTHARARRATIRSGLALRQRLFQLTPARGERPMYRLRNVPPSGFNSRPRAASDHTHWGSLVSSWFQLTPARGERPLAGRVVSSASCFNSRPRAASDHLLGRGRSSGQVSTHARARRATCGRGLLKATQLFQLTPARGERPGAPGKRRPTRLFQLTPARGERPLRK